MFDDDDRLESESVVWKDFLTNVACIFLLAIAVAIFLIHPLLVELADQIKSPGDVIIEAFWPGERDVDIDLWVKSPDDKPVGYARTLGKTFNLLRDDLATVKTTIPHFENVFSRGSPSGEYVVNLHYYSAHASATSNPDTSVVVNVRVSLVNKSSKKIDEIINCKVLLHKEGEETTVVRFDLDKSGVLVKETVNFLPKMLRTAPIKG